MEGGRCITTEFSFTAFLDCHMLLQVACVLCAARSSSSPTPQLVVEPMSAVGLSARHLSQPAERIGSPRHPNFVDRRRFNERMLFHDPTPLYFTNKTALTQRKANTTKLVDLSGGPPNSVSMVDGRPHGIPLPRLSGLFATCESGLPLPSSLYLQPPATARRPTAEKRSQRHDTTPTVARVYGVDTIYACGQQQRRQQRRQQQQRHGLHSASEVEYSETMVESDRPPGLHPPPTLSQQEWRLRDCQWKEEQATLRAEMAAAHGKNARKDIEREHHRGSHSAHTCS